MELNDCTNRVLEVKHALDQYWFKLQYKDNWLITNPIIGKQNSKHSSIMSRNPLYHVHKELLLMLDCLKDYNYWCMGGTLIGALRHENIIAWDGDADVGMMKKDYERRRQRKETKKERKEKKRKNMKRKEKNLPWLKHPAGVCMV